MKGVVSLFVLFSSLTGAAHASNWYAEAGYGNSHGSLPDSAAPFIDVDVDNSDNGWYFGLGYQVNAHLALEASYLDLGTQRAQLTANASGLPLFVEGLPAFDGQVPLNNAPVLGIASPAPASIIETTVYGVRLAGIGQLALSERASLHVQGGAFIPRAVARRSVPHFQIVNGDLEQAVAMHTEVSHEPEFFGGLGVSFDVNDRWAVKLFWEKFIDVGNEKTIEQDLDNYSLAFRYNF